MSTPGAPVPSGPIEEQERRPQAEPLPSKRGEIGYNPDVHGSLNGDHNNGSDVVLPERHPADREHPAPITRDGETGTPPPPPSSATPLSDSSSSSITKSQTLLGFFNSKKLPSFGGVHLTTILIFTLQILVFAGGIVAWIFATKLMKGNPNTSRFPAQSSAVFIHVVFVIATIGQLVFIERRIFRIRAERYSHLHPGEVLPRHRNMSPTPHTAISFAPWNRPPLPTYAAALAQSGVGTGDVEDHLIAQNPPPAYGNTRGSTLLLAGFMRDSMRAHRPQSATSLTPGAATSGRPLSYVSRDEEWEARQDVERAQILEETLSRLEAPPSAMVRH